jgi:heme/copper-type cytochrome/quinol oxidase subunit 2
MYALSALVMGIAATVVTMLIFLPSDWASSRDRSEAWTPGSMPAWTPLGDIALREPVGVTQVGPAQYLVVMEAHNWIFDPDVVRVPVGAEVTFRVRSMEDYHGIAIVGTPVVLSFEHNEVKEATHTFDQPGEYLIVCSEYCGAGHTAMNGMVYVE